MRSLLRAGPDRTVALPRFEAQNLAANRRLIDALAAMARDKGVAPAQIALAWVLQQGDTIVPIPGARKIRHLEETPAPRRSS